MTVDCCAEAYSVEDRASSEKFKAWLPDGQQICLMHRGGGCDYCCNKITLVTYQALLCSYSFRKHVQEMYQNCVMTLK